MNDNDSNIILSAIHRAFPNPLTREHLHLLFNDFIRKIEEQIYFARNPIYYDFTLGTQPYVVDYKGRKHIFIFNTNTTAVNLVSTEGFTIPLPPQAWSPIGHREGSRFNCTTLIPINIKCTDEVVV